MIVVKNNNVNKSASKVRQVCNLIRNRKVEDAIKILRFNEKKEIAIMLTKLVNSGLQIASDSEKYDIDNLIKKAYEYSGLDPDSFYTFITNINMFKNLKKKSKKSWKNERMNEWSNRQTNKQRNKRKSSCLILNIQQTPRKKLILIED